MKESNKEVLFYILKFYAFTIIVILLVYDLLPAIIK